MGPLQATINIPSPPFNWTNRDSVRTISRSQDLLITWSGGDPNSLVEISGVSNLAEPAFGGFLIRAVEFQCAAHAGNGQFAVPSTILSLLPSSSGSLSPPGRISVSNTIRGRFQATGLDFGIIEATSSFGKEVSYQ